MKGICSIRLSVKRLWKERGICNIRLSLTFFITNFSDSLFGVPGEPRCEPPSDVFSDVGVQLFTRAEEHLIAWRHHVVVGDAGYGTIGLEWICLCENMNENVRMKTFRMKIFQMKSSSENISNEKFEWKRYLLSNWAS